MIPWFNVDKLKILRHSDRVRMMKLRAALNSLSNDAMSKYNVRILGKDVSIVMEIVVMGEGDPCSLDVNQIFNVIRENIVISPKIEQLPNNHSLTLTFTFSALDLYAYDKDLLNALYSLGFKEENQLHNESDIVRVLELNRGTATRKFWSILRNLHGDTDPFKSFEDFEDCEYVIYYKYRIEGNDFNRKILDVVR